MHEESIQKKGHLRFVQGVTDEMFELHKRLINELQVDDYLKIYDEAKGNIEAFKSKLQKPEANEIELCFYALYGLFFADKTGYREPDGWRRWRLPYLYP